jgi:hypothetical protein
MGIPGVSSKANMGGLSAAAPPGRQAGSRQSAKALSPAPPASGKTCAVGGKDGNVRRGIAQFNAAPAVFRWNKFDLGVVCLPLAR